MNAHLAAASFFGLFVGAWLGRAVFDWILGIDGDWRVPSIVACAIAGGILGYAAEQEQQGSSRAEDE